MSKLTSLSPAHCRASDGRRSAEGRDLEALIDPVHDCVRDREFREFSVPDHPHAIERPSCRCESKVLTHQVMVAEVAVFVAVLRVESDWVAIGR